MADLQNFSIILHDMDYDDGTDKYKHQYQIVKEQPDTVTSEITQWYDVTDIEFNKNIENMGMEIASKKDGVVKKVAAPPGYSNSVGNEKYGQWKTRSDGTSFWEFYGQYMFISSMFNMMSYPVSRGYYDDYGRSYRSGRSYYGPSSGGKSMYGTNSSYNSSKTSSKWGSKPSSFKSSVRSKVSRSASRSTAAKNSRTSRSSSRYSSSSSRSRSGGYGK